MKKGRIFWGSFFILGGITLLLDRLGIVTNVNIINVIIGIFLLCIVTKNVIKLNFAGILFPIAFIGILFDEQLGITLITPWTILITAGLLSIGLSLIFNKNPKWGKVKIDWDSKDHKKTINIEDEGNIRLETTFGSSVKYINTDKFENANLECTFGGMEVYFDNAIMKNENAVVRIDALFSGIELYIPKTWRVDNKTNVTFGAIEEKNRNGAVITNTLTLVGNITFAGIEIFYI